MFEEVNVAIDHNSLLMDVMGRVAKSITSKYYYTKNHSLASMVAVNTITGL